MSYRACFLEKRCSRSFGGKQWEGARDRTMPRTAWESVTEIWTLHYRRTGWASIVYDHVLHHVVPKTLRQSRISLRIQDTTPVRQSLGERNLGPLRSEVVTGGTGHLFKNNDKLQTISILVVTSRSPTPAVTFVGPLCRAEWQRHPRGGLYEE